MRPTSGKILNRSTFYELCRSYHDDGYDDLADWKSSPKKFRNRIPGNVKKQVVNIALEHSAKFPKELSWFIADTQEYYISESSVRGILKGYDLIACPVYIVLSARDTLKNPTRGIHEL